ncbi:MAG: bifunctional ornithine acetyltransferase/N-acetylglutamate synthase, partial [Pirellulaceae bacterium]
MSRLHVPKGFRFSGVSAGIKSKANAKDVSLIIADQPCTAAGCFTTNQIVAAPVVYSRSLVPSTSVRGVVINSGNANACTGGRGMEDAKKMANLALAAVGGEDDESMLVMSTGIIGRFLPMEKIENGIAMATSSLAQGEDAFLAATDGIMTTDAFRKVESRVMPLRQGEVAMAGMAKGAGMIGPRMATMLAIVVTDAILSPEAARQMLQRAANRSFNRISVEGHMSTNDSLVLLA